jgi:hypothetical protein
MGWFVVMAGQQVSGDEVTRGSNQHQHQHLIVQCRVVAELELELVEAGIQKLMYISVQDLT